MASGPNMVDPAVARDEDSPNREQREMDERRRQMAAQLQQDVMEMTTVLGRLGRTLMQAAPFDFAVRNEGRGNPEANAEGSDASPAGNGGSIPSTILEDVNCNKFSIYFDRENVQDQEIIFEVTTAYNITIKQLISRETVVKSNKSWQWNETNTNEILVDTSNFNHFDYDKISKYARVGAGHSLFNLTENLHSLGRGLLCIPPQADVTVGAAILNGDHSSSLRYPAKFSHQIVVEGSGRTEPDR
ncbi:unnamed protein product [Orchesella dallaii]|uniref:FAD linked oxidase N-terminal domain-containing protein n=1 Tax=Orchesella dallaii TaxID=48710 RepID=A0ABP1R3V2_9HEXA